MNSHTLRRQNLNLVRLPIPPLPRLDSTGLITKAKQSKITSVLSSQEKHELADCVIHESKFYHDSMWHDIKIYDRSRLSAGMSIAGPAIVSEMDSTTVILPDHHANIDQVGNLIINPSKD